MPPHSDTEVATATGGNVDPGATTRWVQITYSPVKAHVGKARELPADEARQLVNEGRAKYIDPPGAAPTGGDGEPAEGAAADAGKTTRGRAK